MKRLTTLLVIILLFVSLLLNFTPVKAQNIERGPNYQIVDNLDGIFTFSSEPQWVYDGTEWQPYIYEYDSEKKCYRIKTGLISGELHQSGIAVFYDVNMTEQIVKSEKWELWQYSGSWKIATLNNPIDFTVTQNITGCYIQASRSTSKPTGTLTIIYHFRVGKSLKHWIYWENLEATEQIVEIRQVWDLAGSITTCEVDNVKTDVAGSITTQSEVVDVSGMYNATIFLFGNTTNPFLVLEDQSKAENLRPTNLDFAGKKVTFSFSNWTLAQNEMLEIDPTTTTYYATASDSGYVQFGPNDFYPPTTYEYFFNAGYVVGQDYVIGYDLYVIYGGFVTIDTSTIPDDATISSAVFIVSMNADHSGTDFDVQISPGGSINTADWTGQRGVSVSPGSVNKYGTTDFSLSSSREGTPPTGEEWVTLGGGQLEVTYTTPPPPTQYYLTVTTSYSTQTGQGWYYDGTTVYAGVSSNTVSGGTGIRYVFTHWSGDASGTNYAQSNGITMTSDKEAVANWKIQYFFDVDSYYDSPTGEGWYDNATETVHSNVTTPFGDYNTTGWTGTGSLASGGILNSNTTGIFTILNYTTCTWDWIGPGEGGDPGGNGDPEDPEDPVTGGSTYFESDIEQILSASDPIDAIGKTSYVITSNVLSCFIILIVLLGAGISYYKESDLWIILMIVFIVLLGIQILIFVAPLVPEFSFMDSWPRMPRAELSYYSFSVQAILQITVVSTLLVLLVSSIFIVSWKGRV